MQLFLGDHWYKQTPSGEVFAEGMIDYKWTEDEELPGEARIVINRVLGIILSLNAIQSADPAEINFTPRESGEPPRYFLATNLPEAAPLISQIAGMGVDPSQELPQQVVQWLKQVIAQSHQQFTLMLQQGMPVENPEIPAEVLVEVSDHTKAECLKTVFDGMAESCGFLSAYQENNLNKNIMGLQPLLVEFDDETKDFNLHNIHPKQWFPDPIKITSDKWNYCIYDEPIDMNEAKAKWPQLDEKIDLFAAEGSLRWNQPGQYDHGQVYLQPFQRPMLVVRTAWVRNQPYPLNEQEAISGGHAVLNEGMEDCQCPQCLGTGSVDPQPEGDPAEVPPQSACPTCQGQGISQKPFRQVLHAKTGEAFNEKHPKWPIRYGIRVVQCIANEVVRDEECGHCDIPMPTNRCIPIPFSPYAFGEPSHLEGLQIAINRVIGHIVTNEAYNAFPVEAVAGSVQERLGKVLKKCRSAPGSRMIVPDDLITQVGDIAKVITNLPTAAMPPDAWKLLDLLLSLIDREGNQADVIRGDASATWSGEAISNLQNAATQVVRGKAMFTEHFLKQVVRLMVHCIQTRMGPEDIAKYTRKYPPSVITAMHEGIQRLEHDISVSISSGSGAAKTSETNNLMVAKKSGVPISMPTVMERLGLNANEEAQKEAVYVRRVQSIMPQQPQIVQPANNNIVQQQGA